MKLNAEQLTQHILPDDLVYQADEGHSEPPFVLGQSRATEALAFGIDIKQPGYNLYVAGENGTGRSHSIRNYLKTIATHQPTPLDWLYVNNFENPREPRALSLPHQQGIQFQKAVSHLIEALLATFPAAFDHPTYQQKKSALQKSFDQLYNQAIDEVEHIANGQNIAVFSEDGSITFTPMIDGQPADENTFSKMDDEQREAFHRDVIVLENLLNDALLELPKWQRDLNDQLRDLSLATIKQSLKPLFDELRQNYPGHTPVQLYLAQVNDNLPRVIEEHLGEAPPTEKEAPINKRNLLESLYLPNLIISSTRDNGAPIIEESNPNYTNLFGTILPSHDTEFSASRYRQIMAGAIHHANGGYLILDVEKVLQDSATWEALKRSLQTGVISNDLAITDAQYGVANTLKPESIPLNVKIILIGPRDIYYTLASIDSEFDTLFRVLVDFSSDFKRTPENLSQFAQAIAQYAAKEHIAELNDGAIARLAEYACRSAEHQNKLSARVADIMDIAIEANYWRKQEHTPCIEIAHINKAIKEREYRNARLSEEVREQVLTGTVVISTSGSAIGQINGLSVIQVGESTFGGPTRITATVHPGSGGVIDIEREVELGQSVHSKGVMLLSGYLCGRYAKNFPLAISARIAMEQSYGFIDGDSASLAELCVLISSLVNVPMRQDIAVTGSMNQRGEVQAVGGINEKIEGFFDICFARGLTGQQGVIIPQTNQVNLMLSERVIDAVKEGSFSIYGMKTVDEALTLLTGLTLGAENKEGKFPANTLNDKIVKKLRLFQKLITPTHTKK